MPSRTGSISQTVYSKRGTRNLSNYKEIEGSSTAIRYKYAKPTTKYTLGKPAIKGTDIQGYTLPITDVDSDKRNFPGYDESQPYSLSDIIYGDRSGSTDTDSVTDKSSDPVGRESGYTRINKRSGSKGRSWKTNSPQKGIN